MSAQIDDHIGDQSVYEEDLTISTKLKDLPNKDSKLLKHQSIRDFIYWLKFTSKDQTVAFILEALKLNKDLFTLEPLEAQKEMMALSGICLKKFISMFLNSVD